MTFEYPFDESYAYGGLTTDVEIARVLHMRKNQEMAMQREGLAVAPANADGGADLTQESPVVYGDIPLPPERIFTPTDAMKILFNSVPQNLLDWIIIIFILVAIACTIRQLARGGGRQQHRNVFGLSSQRTGGCNFCAECGGVI